jgi:hypothetical protein
MAAGNERPDWDIRFDLVSLGAAELVVVRENVDVE